MKAISSSYSGRVMASPRARMRRGRSSRRRMGNEFFTEENEDTEITEEFLIL